MPNDTYYVSFPLRIGDISRHERDRVLLRFAECGDGFGFASRAGTV
jgi:hypothetical protein